MSSRASELSSSNFTDKFKPFLSQSIECILKLSKYGL